MEHNNILKYTITVSLIFAVGLILSGCKSPCAKKKTDTAAKTESMAPSAESAKGSSQLWQENCMRCHNMRSPTSYSDKEWEIAMHHMRVRAALTAEEQRRILEYLQASN